MVIVHTSFGAEVNGELFGWNYNGCDCETNYICCLVIHKVLLEWLNNLGCVINLETLNNCIVKCVCTAHILRTFKFWLWPKNHELSDRVSAHDFRMRVFRLKYTVGLILFRILRASGATWWTQFCLPPTKHPPRAIFPLTHFHHIATRCSHSHSTCLLSEKCVRAICSTRVVYQSSTPNIWMVLVCMVGLVTFNSSHKC